MLDQFCQKTISLAKKLNLFQEIEKPYQELSFFLSKSLRDKKLDLSKAAKFEKLFSKDEIETLFSILKAAEAEYGFSIKREQILAILLTVRGNFLEILSANGKTLILALSSMFVYLTDEETKKIFIISENEYLSKRDFEFSKNLFKRFKINSIYRANSDTDFSIYQQYEKSITYLTLNKLMSDYFSIKLSRNRSVFNSIDLDFLFLDEADTILFDEATRFFSLSSKKEVSLHLIEKIFSFSKRLEKDQDFEIDSKNSVIILTESGYDKLYQFLNQDQTKFFLIYPYVLEALKALYLYRKGIDYVVKDSKIYRIDQITNRIEKSNDFFEFVRPFLVLKENLSFSEVEKVFESRSIIRENSISFLKRAKKLSAVSATLKPLEKTVKSEFSKKVKRIEPFIRPRVEIKNLIIFRSIDEKFNYVVELIKNQDEINQFVVVSDSIEQAQLFSKYFFEKAISDRDRKRFEILSLIDEIDAESEFEKLKPFLEDSNLIDKKKHVLITTRRISRGLDFRQKKLYLIQLERFKSRISEIQLLNRIGRSEGSIGYVDQLSSIDDDFFQTLRDNSKIIEKLFSNFRAQRIENSLIVEKTINSIQKKYFEIESSKKKSIVQVQNSLYFVNKTFFDLRNKLINEIETKEDLKEYLKDLSYYLNLVEIDGRIEKLFENSKIKFESLRSKFLLLIDRNFLEFSALRIDELIFQSNLYMYASRSPLIEFSFSLRDEFFKSVVEKSILELLNLNAKKDRLSIIKASKSKHLATKSDFSSIDFSRFKNKPEKEISFSNSVS